MTEPSSAARLGFAVVPVTPFAQNCSVIWCTQTKLAAVVDPRGNHQQLLQSIRQGLFPLGDEIRFVPGHGPMSTFGAERRSNPFVADHRFG